MAFKAEDAVKSQQQTKRWIWKEKQKMLSGMVVTYQLCKCSEEIRDLSALNLLPTNDQDP